MPCLKFGDSAIERSRILTKFEMLYVLFESIEFVT